MVDVLHILTYVLLLVFIVSISVLFVGGYSLNNKFPWEIVIAPLSGVILLISFMAYRSALKDEILSDLKNTYTNYEFTEEITESYHGFFTAYNKDGTPCTSYVEQGKNGDWFLENGTEKCALP